MSEKWGDDLFGERPHSRQDSLDPFMKLVMEQRGCWHTKTIIDAGRCVAEVDDGGSYPVIAWAHQFLRPCEEAIFDGPGGEPDLIQERIVGLILEDSCVPYPVEVDNFRFDGFKRYAYQGDDD